MSEQPPLTPPSGPLPGPSGPAGPVPPGPPAAPTSFEPYSAPAYGEVGADETGGGPAPLSAPLSAPPIPAGPPATGGPGWSPYPVSPQGAPYQMAPQYLGAAGAPTHPLATTSLVLGLIGLFSLLLTPVLLVTFVGALCSPFAIWLGARARREIRANPLSYGGEGVAMGGFVTGIVGVVLGIIGLILIIILVAFFAALIGSA